MKKAIVFFILALLCSACKTVKYVPIETVKTEYRDKILRDSIFINDTIRVPYPVEVVKKVKKPLSNWQNFQVWCGRIALSIILLTIIYFCRKLTIFAQ